MPVLSRLPYPGNPRRGASLRTSDLRHSPIETRLASAASSTLKKVTRSLSSPRLEELRAPAAVCCRGRSGLCDPEDPDVHVIQTPAEFDFSIFRGNVPGGSPSCCVFAQKS